MFIIFLPYYEKRALLARALAHPLRVQLTDLLTRRGEHCVCELTEKVSASQSSVSKHLSILREAGVVECRKEGLQVYYQIRTPCVIQFLHCLDSMLKEDMGRQVSCLYRDQGDSDRVD